MIVVFAMVDLVFLVCFSVFPFYLLPSFFFILFSSSFSFFRPSSFPDAQVVHCCFVVVCFCCKKCDGNIFIM